MAKSIADLLSEREGTRLDFKRDLSHEEHDLLLLRASYAAGPFFIKSKGKDKGTLIRIGSNSLPASPEKIAELERARHMSAWDQEPMPRLGHDDLDHDLIKRWLDPVGERQTDAKLRSLGVLTEYGGELVPSSPGTWPPGFSREDFESGMSLRRNKAISRVLTRLEIIEGYGSGFDRITAECRAGGYPQPEWVENGPQIKVVLWPHPSSGPSTELGADTKRPSQQSSSARLAPQERRDIVLAAIGDLDRPSAADIQAHTGIAPRTLERDLRQLRSAGLVEFIGPRQRGFYRRIGKP
jgi:predicted HTH transcriptional regulator